MTLARNILLLIAGIALIQLLIWIPILRWMRRRSAAALRALNDEIAASGEQVRRGPESGVYRGSTGTYSQIAGNCVVVLTDKRLVFVKLTGGRVDVPVEQIVGAREAKVFKSTVVAGRMHLIVSTRDGGEVGFFARDNAAWLAALARASSK